MRCASIQGGWNLYDHSSTLESSGHFYGVGLAPLAHVIESKLEPTSYGLSARARINADCMEKSKRVKRILQSQGVSKRTR